MQGIDLFVDSHPFNCFLGGEKLSECFGNGLSAVAIGFHHSAKLPSCGLDHGDTLKKHFMSPHPLFKL